MYADGSIEIFVVASGYSQSDKRIINEGSSSSNNPLYGLTITTKALKTDWTPTFVSTQISHQKSKILLNDVAMDGTYKILSWKDTGSSIVGRVNGGTSGSASYSRSGTMSTNRFCVGGILRASFSYGFTGNIKELLFLHQTPIQTVKKSRAT